jgi:hypothetical protein
LEKIKTKKKDENLRFVFEVQANTQGLSLKKEEKDKRNVSSVPKSKKKKRENRLNEPLLTYNLEIQAEIYIPRSSALKKKKKVR